MKWSLLAPILFVTSSLAGNLLLEINGQKFEISEDQVETLELKNGDELKVRLTKKSTATFDAPMFSVDHPGQMSASREDLGDGIHQTILVTPNGTLALVQEYETVDPSSLIDLLIDELTEEEVSFGYKLEKQEAEKTLADGSIAKGLKVVTTHEEEEYTRFVLTVSKDGQGLMLLSQFEKSAPEEDSAMIDQFWKTLRPKL